MAERIATRGAVRRGSAAGVAALLLAASRACLALSLSADFDSASLDIAASAVIGGDVTLVGRDNYNTGDWKWLYFRADGVQSTSPVFSIGDNFETGASSLNGHAMVYSYDQQDWFFFDNNVRNAASGTFRFWNSTPFAQDGVYVAYGLPYPAGRAASHSLSLASSPWVTDLPSSVGLLTVGQSPGGVDDLGRAIAPSDLYGYRVHDPSGAADRATVVLASGVHANETLGNFVLEGLVDFLIGDSLEAALLRKAADFAVYPLANPDGRLAGYNRSTVANESQDPNRYWDSPSYGGIPELQTIGSAMLADTAESADYLIDFHSTVNGKAGHYAFVHPDMQSDPLWQSFLQHEPTVETRNAVLSDDTLPKFGRDELGAAFSITFETEFLAGENIDRYLAIGESWGHALAESLVVFADLNLDGELSRADWALLIAAAETDLSSLSPIDAYLHGDLDGDGLNSIQDFSLFKNAYESAHGLGSLAKLIAAPEPSAGVSFVLSVSLLATTRVPIFDRSRILCTAT
ncbi:Zinc carboxypeptidase [Posidoniimonas polymericola]|uniref:Zinc carboxypeptidase n=1 Tax=Posidoniimonas polymericola TaxID=2528002 RepID=A0A5C5YU68_9BACT|nr:M14-type cytosolic carboxypeptidase [Posidoniimonas polymericola]TWT78316.1 Zinc carboxypeptidase [Posidoniimonas polymericola]